MDKLKKNIRILGMLYIVLGGLSVITLLITTIFKDKFIALNPNSPMVQVLQQNNSGILVVSIISAVLSMIAGISLIHNKAWSRILGIVVSVIEILSFPIGTIIGFFGIWTLTRPQAKEVLSK